MGLQISSSNTLLQRLLQIREHPYVLGSSRRSLDALVGYIAGYVGGYRDACAGDIERQSEVLWYVAFKAYVTDVCVGSVRAYGVKSAIMEVAHDDDAGFDEYYKLLDEFLEEMKRDGSKVQGYVEIALRGRCRRCAL